MAVPLENELKIVVFLYSIWAVEKVLMKFKLCSILGVSNGSHWSLLPGSDGPRHSHWNLQRILANRTVDRCSGTHFPGIHCSIAQRIRSSQHERRTVYLHSSHYRRCAVAASALSNPGDAEHWQCMDTGRAYRIQHRLHRLGRPDLVSHGPGLRTRRGQDQ